MGWPVPLVIFAGVALIIVIERRRSGGPSKDRDPAAALNQNRRQPVNAVLFPGMAAPVDPEVDETAVTSVDRRTRPSLPPGVERTDGEPPELP